MPRRRALTPVREASRQNSPIDIAEPTVNYFGMNKLLLLGALGLLLGKPSFALEVGDTGPCASVRDLQTDGSVIDQCVTSRLAGTSFTYLEFFSTSCGDCQATLPKTSALAERIKRVATVRMVGIDRDENALRLFINVHKNLIHFPVALDTDRIAKAAYGVRTTPSGFLLDDQERVIFVSTSGLTDADAKKIEEIVGASEPADFSN